MVNESLLTLKSDSKEEKLNRMISREKYVLVILYYSFIFIKKI